MGVTLAPRGKTIDVHVGKQTVAFATAAANDYVNTFILSHTLEGKDPFVDDPVLGLPRTNDRDATAPGPGLLNLAGNIVVPIDFNHFGIWLQCVLGNAVDTGSADPYTHVFTSGAETLPWLTMEVALKLAGGNEFMQYMGLVGSKLTFELARAAGYAKATVEMMGRTETMLGASGAGSPTAAYAREPVPEVLGLFKMAGSTAANITKMTATYDNKLKAQDFLGDTTGLVSGFDLDTDATFTGAITLRFRDTTFYNQAVSGAPFVGQALYQQSSNRLLQLDMPITYLERTGVPISGPAGIEQTFNFRCAQDSTHPMLTATLKSLVATYN